MRIALTCSLTGFSLLLGSGVLLADPSHGTAPRLRFAANPPTGAARLEFDEATSREKRGGQQGSNHLVQSSFQPSAPSLAENIVPVQGTAPPTRLPPISAEPQHIETVPVPPTPINGAKLPNPDQPPRRDALVPIPPRSVTAQPTPCTTQPGSTILAQNSVIVVPDRVATGIDAWLNVGVLWGWTSSARLVPLSSQSPAGTPLGQAGVLGTPGTRVLYGNQSSLDDGQLGFRLQTGIWLNPDRRIALEADLLWLGSIDQHHRSGSPDGSTIVSRPFVDANTGLPNAELVAFPGVLGGFVDVRTSTSGLWGVGTGFRMATSCDPCRPVDLAVGYRHFRFEDSLRIRENLVPLDPGAVPGSTIVVRDSFQAENTFHGGYLGLHFRRFSNGWDLGFSPQVNLGQTRSVVTIQGDTVNSVPGLAPVRQRGGLLALPSNIGTYAVREFSVIPELQLSVGKALTPRSRISIGYSLIGWLGVARAAEQVDPVVNRNLLPPAANPVRGPQRPQFDLDRSDLWVHGIQATFEWLY